MLYSPALPLEGDHRMFSYLLALSPIQQALLRIDITKGESSTLVEGLTDGPDGIVVDPDGKYVYWTNMGAPGLPEGRAPKTDDDLDFYRVNGSLERVDIDGTGRAYILPVGSFVTGKQLAGAWSAGRLYWSDREGAAVRSARLDGSDLRDEVVVATSEADRRIVRNQCVGVAIDEQQGLLYWTQKGPANGNDGRIFRTSLNAPVGEREIEVLWSELPEPIDLELDLDTKRIYWTDRGDPPRGNTLNQATVPAVGQRGGEVAVVSANYHETIGLAVDTQAGLAYVSDLSGQIRAVRLDGSGEHLVFKTDKALTGIAGV
jgi:DNA-binding beta-propeller fold protein YncE